jgi:hypothetical protein
MQIQHFKVFKAEKYAVENLIYLDIISHHFGRLC